MASLKFRVDTEEENKHGQFLGYAKWMGGPSLSRIRNCRRKDEGTTVTAYITGEPDTFFSQPARINKGKKSIKGYVTCKDNLWEFHAF